MFCRVCGAREPAPGTQDARGVCAACAPRIAAGFHPTELYCLRCGRGPGHTHIFDAEGVCWHCRKDRSDSGLAAPGVPPARPPIPCTRCQGTRFVRVPSWRERGVSGSGAHVSQRVAPLAVTFELDAEKRPDPKKPLGALELYACRSCGKVEIYARDMEEVPIGEIYGTELFEAAGGGPFRV